jgi:hypothetical protein
VNARPTQCGSVLALLEDGCWHSTIEFVELGVLRVSARVHELRRRGFVIEVRRVEHPGGAAVYAYRLATAEPAVERHEEPAAAADQLELGAPVDPVHDERPSLDERRRIAAAAREAFARAVSERSA